MYDFKAGVERYLQALGSDGKLHWVSIQRITCVSTMQKEHPEHGGKSILKVDGFQSHFLHELPPDKLLNLLIGNNKLIPFDGKCAD